MQRELARLANREFDLVVVGAGIYGACIAWDAALRGLRVALVEKGDFGHATSANSLKIIHGGLRYLQDANVPLVRTMIRERRAFLRIAPHLVHPLPCLVPTRGHTTHSRWAMRAALTLNDLIGWDRNRGVDPDNHLPRGRLLSREACRALLPDGVVPDLTGGALWYDGQIYNSERLTLAFVQSAARVGAVVANYVEATDLLRDGRAVIGIHARDQWSGRRFEVRARLVINAAGPWVDHVLAALGDRRPPSVHLSTAMNLVTRQILPTYAVGLPSRHEVRQPDGRVEERSRLLFMAPWRGYSIIGTDHAPYDGPPSDRDVSEERVATFLREVNGALPGLSLTRADVRRVHWGLLPSDVPPQTGRVRLLRQGLVLDHGTRDGIDGLLSVVGVKYTASRHVAQQAVDQAFQKLQRPVLPCMTDRTPLYGGQIEQVSAFLAARQADPPPGLDAETIRHLVYTYGTAYARVLAHAEENPAWRQPLGPDTRVLGVEIIHAVRNEMAQTLADVVFRRTELGAAGDPGDRSLAACAFLMEHELGWEAARTARELDAVRADLGLPGRHPPTKTEWNDEDDDTTGTGNGRDRLHGWAPLQTSR